MSERKKQNRLSSSSNSSLNSGVSGGERILSTRLQTALSKTVDKYVSSLRFSKFKEKYRDIYESDPESFKLIYKQLCTQLINVIKSELHGLCKEYNIDALLFSLENIIKACEDNVNKESWRPSGNAKEDLRDHVFEVKLKHKEILQQQLIKISSENEELHKTITVLEDENVSLRNHVQSGMDDLKKVMNIFNESKFAILQDSLHDIVGNDVEDFN